MPIWGAESNTQSIRVCGNRTASLCSNKMVGFFSLNQVISHLIFSTLEMVKEYSVANRYFPYNELNCTDLLKQSGEE